MISSRSLLSGIPPTLVVVFAFSLCWCADESAAQQSRPNLSGTWKLNRAKSRLRSRHAVDSCVIKHSDPRISMVRMSEAGRVTDFYVTDGKEHAAHSDNYEQMRAKAHWDGNTLVIENRMEMGNFREVTVWVSRYELSIDGKTLVVSEHVVKSSSGHDFDRLLTYEKQL